jgi:hypothetical protein
LTIGVRADAEGESRDRDDREPGALAEGPKRVADVAAQLVE